MMRILIKPELCAGCKNCQVACLAEHSPSGSVWLVNLSGRDGHPRNSVELNSCNMPVPLTCRHCDDPECVTACMTGALSKNPFTELVEHDPERCAGCWMCVMSCPFGMISQETLERKTAVKCDFCKKRETPRCVEACPTGAICLVEVSPEAGTNTTHGRAPKEGSH